MILTRRLRTKEGSQTPKIGDRRSSGMLKTIQVLREPIQEKSSSLRLREATPRNRPTVLETRTRLEQNWQQLRYLNEYVVWNGQWPPLLLTLLNLLIIGPRNFHVQFSPKHWLTVPSTDQLSLTLVKFPKHWSIVPDNDYLALINCPSHWSTDFFYAYI